jgi:hypothetical protein
MHSAQVVGHACADFVEALEKLGQERDDWSA